MNFLLLSKTTQSSSPGPTGCKGCWGSTSCGRSGQVVIRLAILSCLLVPRRDAATCRQRASGTGDWTGRPWTCRPWACLNFLNSSDTEWLWPWLWLSMGWINRALESKMQCTQLVIDTRSTWRFNAKEWCCWVVVQVLMIMCQVLLKC